MRCSGPALLPSSRAEQAVQRLVVGPDGGPGFRPGLPHALGYSGRDVLARGGFGGGAQRLGQPAVHGGRRSAQRVGLGGESGPAAGRVHGEPPGVPAAGEEFVGHSEFALRRRRVPAGSAACAAAPPTRR